MSAVSSAKSAADGSQVCPGHQAEAAALRGDALARIPAPLHPLLTPPSGASLVPAALITDPAWLRAEIRLRGRSWPTSDQHVLGTLWWYSASHYLVTPTVATLLLTGRAASPALADLVLHHHPDGTVSGAHSTAVLSADLDTVAGALRAMLSVVIDAVATLTRHGVRPLWALATDGLAERLLFLGAATGRTDEACRLADRLSRGIGAPLLPPRFSRRPGLEVNDQSDLGRRVLRRVSCCLLYRVPGEEICLSCPRRPPSERLQALIPGGDRLTPQ